MGYKPGQTAWPGMLGADPEKLEGEDPCQARKRLATK